jgi:hypothetical protein
MCTYYLKSYSQKEEIRKPHFFILNKGNNSGKPLNSPCPNCFVVMAENQEQTDQLCTLCYALWRCRAFEQHLHGSVIPFITIRSFRSILAFYIPIIEKYATDFAKTVQALKLLEEREQQLTKTLRAVSEYKQAFVRQFFRNAGV